MTATLKALIFPRFFPQLMKLKAFGVCFTVSFPAIAFLAIAIICDRKGTVLLCLIASFMHEAGHILAMLLKGAKLKSVRINLGDVAIDTESTTLSYDDEIFISVSGVFINLILSLFSLLLFLFIKLSFCYNFFIVNLLIALFNLLPIRFLDGGQLLLFLLKKHFSIKTCDIVINILTVVFVVPVGVLGFIFVFNSSYNFSLLFTALYLISTLVSKEFKNVS